MQARNRTALSWKSALATVGGLALMGWAVDGLLPWLQQTALIFGVVLIAYGMGSSLPRVSR